MVIQEPLPLFLPLTILIYIYPFEIWQKKIVFFYIMVFLLVEKKQHWHIIPL